MLQSERHQISKRCRHLDFRRQHYNEMFAGIVMVQKIQLNIEFWSICVMLRVSRMMLSQIKSIFANIFSYFLARWLALLCIQAQGRQPPLYRLRALRCFGLYDVNQYKCSEPFHFSFRCTFYNMEWENSLSPHIYCMFCSIEQSFCSTFPEEFGSLFTCGFIKERPVANNFHHQPLNIKHAIIILFESTACSAETWETQEQL